MSYDVAVNKLSQINQEHLLYDWKYIPNNYKAHVLAQVNQLDINFLQQASKNRASPSLEKISPISEITTYNDPKNIKSGFHELKNKKVGCVILAGGEGSRLQSNCPKGLFTISNDKTLLQLALEKVCSISKISKQPLPVAIMTSQSNQSSMQKYVYDNNYFGLRPEQVTFFSQSMWPLLTIDYKLFWTENYNIACGPNGNGSFANHLSSCGLLDSWLEDNIHTVNVISIDNPLAIPFDPDLCGFHHLNNNDISIASILRENPIEDVGVLARNNKGEVIVAEYSEISEKNRFEKDASGNLLFNLANIGIYSFSTEFLYKIKDMNPPIHIARKPAKQLFIQKGIITQIESLKLELFIFDLFAFAEKCSLLVYPREECFAPLKTTHGKNGLAEMLSKIFYKEKSMFKLAYNKDLDRQDSLSIHADLYYLSKQAVS